ncbi:hypothetical protein K435DRAFT_806393 [Dendrothele bispora CBS 962.96]|uniref:Uncharacterized protein n=1 Tax=Dendrothele bispora (strain CBS 962.96) TaxID=1314807 RepID=A0A4S8L7Z1_DENBC|nr:hypothetical protein K435DRAFT_806393 [Dendrothele bispora CBS 962.96]
MLPHQSLQSAARRALDHLFPPQTEPNSLTGFKLYVNIDLLGVVDDREEETDPSLKNAIVTGLTKLKIRVKAPDPFKLLRSQSLLHLWITQPPPNSSSLKRRISEELLVEGKIKQVKTKKSDKACVPDRGILLSSQPLVSREESKVVDYSNLSGLVGKARKAQRTKNRRDARRTSAHATGVTTVSFNSNDFDFTLDTNVSKPAWQGVNVNAKERNRIVSMWESGGWGESLKGLRLVPYEENMALSVRDSNLRQFLYRSRVTSKIANKLPEVSRVVSDFVRSIKQPNAEKDMLDNLRGHHWYSILGHDRNNRKVPSLSQFHQKNASTLGPFFQEGSLFWFLTEYGCGLLRAHFPQVAKRYQDCATKLEEMYGIKPLFGLFWNFCVNVPRAGIRRVHCKPHIDYKNIALGVCMIFVFGHFNHHERCWLVLWEAGIAVELPPGVFLIYPSSLFLHFNIDLQDLPVFTTSNNEMPSRSNLTSIGCSCSETAHQNDSDWQEAVGRGSMVWFSQATMFQSAELGYDTVGLAKEAGVNPTCPVDKWLDSGLFAVPFQ